MVTNQDLNTMQTYGRYVARDDDRVALANAVEYMIIAGLDTEDADRLRFWFHEGVRNYARDQKHTDECMGELASDVSLYLLKKKLSKT